MSTFLSPLHLRAFSPVEMDGDTKQLYMLTQEFVYESDLLDRITVPIGFVTDFASIPGSALWWLDDDDPRILFPSVVHDFLYSGLFKCTREQADAVLKEAMLACGARTSQAWAVHRAVRIGGGSRFKSFIA